MSTSYPNNIDTDVELPRIDDGITEISGDNINAIRDAILSVEKTIGINPQGNMPDFVSRVNGVIDANGNIKLSAISSIGLVTLPITNLQIASNAGILESKLVLDYNTAFLKARIDSNTSDINNLATVISGNGTTLSRHIAGSTPALRHDGYAIDLANPIRGQTILELGIDAINNELIAHEIRSSAHDAYNINVINDFITFSATNVQDALNALDAGENNLLAKHQGVLHKNSIGVDGYSILDQGTDLSSTLLSTVYKTNTSLSANILQVMPQNAARVTSVNINLNKLNSTTKILKIFADGVTTTSLIIDLTSILPVLNIQTLVDYINTQAHSSLNHYPISAYVNGEELTIAHHMVGKQYTINIQDNGVLFSAATALGFGSIVDQNIGYSGNNHVAFVDGYNIYNLKTLVDVVYNHTNSDNPDTLNLNIGSLSNYGLTIGNQGRVLCHINGHNTTPTANGTYYIINYPNSTSIRLNAAIPNGIFEVTILSDSLAFDNTTFGQVWDIFLQKSSLDGYGDIVKSLRASYGNIAGLSIASLNENFSSGTLNWSVTGGNTLSFIDPSTSIVGTSQNIPSSFVGSLILNSPDNVGQALIQVSNTISSLTNVVNVFDYAGSKNSLYLSSVHYAGIFGVNNLKYVVDKRTLGGTLDNKTNDPLNKLSQALVLSDIRNNGIVYGFDVISNTTNTITLRGGRAYVSGNMLDVSSQILTLNTFVSGTNLILLDKFGKYIIVNSTNVGYDLASLLLNNSYGDNREVAPIASFNITSSTITNGSFVDVRLFIDKLDKKVYNNTNSISLLGTTVNNIQTFVNTSIAGFRDCIINFQGTAVSSAGTGTPFGSIPAGGQIFSYTVLPWNGSIAALSFSAENFTISSGSITLQIQKNGSPMTPSVTLNSTAGTNNKVNVVFPVGLYTFNAGDSLYLTYTSTGMTGGSSFNSALWVYYS